MAERQAAEKLFAAFAFLTCWISDISKTDSHTLAITEASQMETDKWLAIATILSGFALAAATALAPSLAEIIKTIFNNLSLGRSKAAIGCLFGSGCVIAASLFFSLSALFMLVLVWMNWSYEPFEPAIISRRILVAFCLFSIASNFTIVILHAVLSKRPGLVDEEENQVAI